MSYWHYYILNEHFAPETTEISLDNYPLFVYILQLKLYDKVRPLQIELTDLRGWNSTLEHQVSSYKEDLAQLQQVV